MASQTTFILLGNTGAGKSASGNTIFGQTVFKSEQSFESVTTEISEQGGTVLGQQISVIDTPGILGPDGEEGDSCTEKDSFWQEDSRAEVKIKTHCDKLLQEGRSCYFLIVVKIARFTREQKDAVEAALRVIGKEQVKNSCLLFTCKDTLNNKTLEEFLNVNRKGFLWKLVQEFGERYHIFDNKSREQNQVEELLRKSGVLRPDAEHQTSGTTPGTCATQSTDTEPAAAAVSSVPEMRIVLLGLPGAGKSSSGNTILGRTDFFKPSGSFNPVTTETVSKSANVEGRRVTVVDTPGITDEVLDPKKLFEELMKSIKETEPGPHAFIFVVPLNRISEAAEKLFEILPKLFDQDASKYCMVLFTHADNLEGGNIAENIDDNNAMSKLVEMCGRRYCVINNRQIGNRQQVRELLNNIDQMVRSNGGSHYTSDLFNNVHKSNWRETINEKWHHICEWLIAFLKKISMLIKSKNSRNAYVPLLSQNPVMA